MARTKDKLALLLVALALGAAFLAIHYEIEWAIALVIAACGIVMLVSGLGMIVSRKARVPTDGSDLNPRAEYHAGFTAQLWGVLYVMISAALVALAYSIWPSRNGAEDLVRVISESSFLSGFIMINVGAGIAMYGLTRLLARKEAFVETRISTGERYFMGAYACLAGGLVLAIGFLRAFAPELLSALRNAAVEFIKESIRRL
jgi:hypothetical protein